MVSPFHLAIPVNDLALASAFYGGILGCKKGRSDRHWIDWDLFGHQLVTHAVKTMPTPPEFNVVDGHHVPVPHFGVVLDMHQWQTLANKLKDADIAFIVEPYIRFKGQPGEQATMFFLDPAGNALEFKAFNDIKQLFAVD